MKDDNGNQESLREQLDRMESAIDTIGERQLYHFWVIGGMIAFLIGQGCA